MKFRASTRSSDNIYAGRKKEKIRARDQRVNWKINTLNRAGVGIETIKEREIPLSPFSSLASTEYQTPPADPHSSEHVQQRGAGPNPATLR